MYAADLLILSPVVPEVTNARILRVLLPLLGIVIETSPDVLSVTPARNCKAPVAPLDGIDDIIVAVKSVPFANRMNLKPAGKVSLISSTTTSAELLLLTSLML